MSIDSPSLIAGMSTDGLTDEVMRTISRVAKTDPVLARQCIAYNLFNRRAPKAKAPQHVYFIRATVTGLVKIGCASDPAGRLKALQIGSAETLDLLAVWRDAGRDGEREMHELFASFRAHGEWFYPSEELDAAIGACR